MSQFQQESARYVHFDRGLHQKSVLYTVLPWACQDIAVYTAGSLQMVVLIMGFHTNLHIWPQSVEKTTNDCTIVCPPYKDRASTRSWTYLCRRAGLKGHQQNMKLNAAVAPKTRKECECMGLWIVSRHVRITCTTYTHAEQCMRHSNTLLAGWHQQVQDMQSRQKCRNAKIPTKTAR